MKRLGLAVLLAVIVAVGVMSVMSWRKDDFGQDGTGKVQPVLAVGVDIPSTVDEGQEQLIRALAGSAGEGLAEIVIDYPMNESIFPGEMVAPTFLWHDGLAQSDRWLIEVALGDGSAHVYVLSEGEPPSIGDDDPRCYGATNKPFEPSEYQASAKSWTPTETVWEAIKDLSVDQAATVTVIGHNSQFPERALSLGRMTLTSSSDPVDGMIFYRDVPLMPDITESGVIKPLVPEALPLIQWRLKDISRHDSRVVLQNMPTCGNCHSFSDDGRTLAMDIDGPAGDKGAYAIAQIEEHMSIGHDEIITWNDFSDKPAGHNKTIRETIGFLSRVSPDGQYVVTTVNEMLYVSNFTSYEFLQVFYPTGGILAYYNTQTRRIQTLPGANDPDYVQCDPVWSPDGEWIVFARAEAQDPRVATLAAYANDPAELQIRYDLYRMRFDGGRGGTPQRIEGASGNGMSNTFPKISPDGKWIVFVKCRNGQLMRPDSELWIVPFEGGQARRMRCNQPGEKLNSWHSFSPNGRWMVFSSKVNTPYTQMFLTHLDEDGNDGPPILIPNATASNRAVNLPEFVNIEYDDLVSITVPSVEYYRHIDNGLALHKEGQLAEAADEVRKALAMEEESVHANYLLGMILYDQKQYGQSLAHHQRVLEIDPTYFLAHHAMAVTLHTQGDVEGAIAHLEEAVSINPEFTEGWEYLTKLETRLEDAP